MIDAEIDNRDMVIVSKQNTGTVENIVDIRDIKSPYFVKCD